MDFERTRTLVVILASSALLAAGCSGASEPTTQRPERPTSQLEAKAFRRAPIEVTPLKELHGLSSFAFTRSRGDRGTSDIWVRMVSGEEVKVADTDEYLDQPAWSPDGRSLAYNCGPGGTYDMDLCVLDRAGKQRKLTERVGFEGSPSFSPDGRSILFAWVRRGSADLYTVSLSDGSWTRLTDTRLGERSPVWSPDGRWIAYTTPHGLTVAGSDGSNPQLLARDVTDRPDWSPDGRWLVYAKDIFGGPEIFKTPAPVPGEEIRLTNLNLVVRAPSWSPNGKTIAFPYGGNVHIAAIPAAGGHIRKLTDSIGAREYSMDWAPR